MSSAQDEDEPDLTKAWNLLRPQVLPQMCHCLCFRWGHRGICEGEAQTSALLESTLTGVVEVPLCRACAEAINRGRAQ